MDLRNYQCNDYVIVKGDTLYSISKEHNIPLALLIRVNPYVDIYNLQIGDELCIPIIKPIFENVLETYTVRAGESLEDVLNKTGMNLSELLQFNSLSNLMLLEGSTIIIPNHNNNMD